MATILRAILDAQDKVNLAFLLAPQAFRRQSKRGGEDGQSYVAGRFNAAIEDDWGTVLHHLMVNRVREEERKRSRKGRGKENSETEKKEIQRKVALSHLSKGEISKAVSRLTSFWVASTEDPAVMAALRVKYGAASHRPDGTAS